MTTYPLRAGSTSSLSQTIPSAPRRPVPSALPSDLMALTNDRDSLAQHMRHCASARHRWPRLQTTLQSTHCLLLPRIVTVVALAALMAVASSSAAVIMGWAAAV